jgi:hypothetical protein
MVLVTVDRPVLVLVRQTTYTISARLRPISVLPAPPFLDQPENQRRLSDNPGSPLKGERGQLPFYFVQWLAVKTRPYTKTGDGAQMES